MNIDKCEPKTRNTASSRCKYEWGMFRRIVVTPLKKVYTGLDENNQPITFDEWLLRGIHAARTADRFYPMPYFSDSVSTTTSEAEAAMERTASARIWSALVGPTPSIQPSAPMKSLST